MITARTTDGRVVDLTPTVVDGFRTRIRGPMLAPGDAGYQESRTVWNAMIDRQPALVVRCLGVADVVACVQFAREHQLLLCVKGGGHNIAGLATADGALMLDLSLMRGVWVDPAAQGRPRPGRLPARRRGSRDAAARAGDGPGIRLAHRHRRPHARRRLWLPHPPVGLDDGQRRRHGSGHRRRAGDPRERRRRIPTCSGACAAVGAISVS